MIDYIKLYCIFLFVVYIHSHIEGMYYVLAQVTHKLKLDTDKEFN